MHDLASFQREFARAMIGGRGALARQPDFAVYRNTAIDAAMRALAASFPTIEALLGTRRFAQLAQAYAHAVRPHSAVLSAYGQGFPDWLALQAIADPLPYLPHVARIDWLCLEAQLSADGPLLDTSALEDRSPEAWSRRRALLHPAARIVWFPLPAASVWLAQREDRIGQAFAPDWLPEGVLVTRPDGAVRVLALDAAAHRLIFGLRIGETVAAAALAAAQLYPAADIPASFARLLSSGAIASFVQKDR